MKTAEEIIKDRMKRINATYIADLTTTDIVDMMNEYALKELKNSVVQADVSGECLHPYNSVRKDKITELCTCSICEKEWY